MIQLANVHKYFHRRQIHALNGINLEIDAGEFVVLVGSNGSGKSTLLNLLSGNILPDEGQINIEGIDVSGMADYKRSKWIARVFQNPLSGTASELTVIENFRLASIRTSPKSLKLGITKKFESQVKEKISGLRLGLEDKTDQPMGSLSGGQRQALTLLMAVMDDTKLLLMDEPVSALDPGTASLVMRLASDLISEHKLTAIMVTHSLRDAHQYGNRIIQLAEGTVKRNITGSEKKSIAIEQLYSWF